MEHAYLAEVIDPATEKLVPPGRTGELVLTTLGRIASPLLRYRTGDLVKISTQPCACGRSELALEGGILGRTDDMVVVRGVNIHTGAVEEIIRGCSGVREYQVTFDTRHALAELSVTIEAASEASDSSKLADKLEKAFQSAFSLRVPVRVASLGTLPRFEMKAKRWFACKASITLFLFGHIVPFSTIRWPAALQNEANAKAVITSLRVAAHLLTYPRGQIPTTLPTVR